MPPSASSEVWHNSLPLSLFLRMCFPMSYKLEQFDEGRIVVNTLGEDFDIVNDMLVSALDSIEVFDNGPDRIVLITDARLVKIKSLEEILQGGKLINDERVRRAT